MESIYHDDIVEQMVYKEDGSELFLYYSTKAERNAVLSDLRRQKRILYKEFDDLEVGKILIENIGSTDGKFGVKISKGSHPPIAAFVKNPDGTVEVVDLEEMIWRQT